MAPPALQQWFALRRPPGDGTRGRVLPWPDTSTNHARPAGQAAVDLLENAGWPVITPARRRTRSRAGTQLHCRVRADLPELFSPDQDVRRLRDQIVTLTELLTGRSPGYRPSQMDTSAVARAHSRQHAVMDWDAGRELLHRAGVAVERLEQGDSEVSEACAEQVLLADTAVLADGFSCRTQSTNSAEAATKARISRNCSPPVFAVAASRRNVAHGPAVGGRGWLRSQASARYFGCAAADRMS